VSSLAVADSSNVVACVRGVHHRYGDHLALDGVDLDVRSGEIFALLGPNGSGKTTLFRLLCTLLPVQRGRITVGGFDSQLQTLAVRARIGIVFQSPSLDKKLTVDENIACQAALYGIKAKDLEVRRDQVLRQFDLEDRRGDYCETLSGGLKRRVELAKGMLHRPQLLLLDEPSTGLDPAARLSFWQAIETMADDGMAILMTTHLLEEAEKANRVAIMAAGKLIAEGTPHQLRAGLGSGIVTVVASDVVQVEQILHAELNLETQRLGNQLRLQTESPEELVPVLIQRLGDLAQSITIGRPSLEDVFITRTGHAFDMQVAG
jgi:ABC-2 type transport system ATP-binding protein